MNRTDEAKVKLGWRAEQGRQCRQKIADAMLKSSGDAEYEMRWLEGKYKTIRIGQLAEFAQEDEGLDAVVQFVQRTLASWRPQSSTSAYSNACHNEEFSALREFLDEFEHLVEVGVKAA